MKVTQHQIVETHRKLKELANVPITPINKDAVELAKATLILWETLIK